MPVVIRTGTGNGTQYQDDEDPYGRCMNMKLTSFADSNARDPRIIDLNSSQNSGLNQMSPRTGSPVSVAQQQQNFNTLPAHVSIGLYNILSVSDKLCAKFLNLIYSDVFDKIQQNLKDST